MKIMAGSPATEAAGTERVKGRDGADGSRPGDDTRGEKRPYRMTARAEAAERTGRAILAAAVELWREKGLEEMTLQEIADGAGVTVQTVIRRFGSKDGVVDAALETDASGIEAQRATARRGDVAGAIDVLLDHYEEWGEPTLRTLAVEDRLPAAGRLVARGRAGHRAWCRDTLAPEGADDVTVDALVVVTDVYAWKLLRRDMGRERETAAAVMTATVQAVLARLPGGEGDGAT